MPDENFDFFKVKSEKVKMLLYNTLQFPKKRHFFSEIANI